MISLWRLLTSQSTHRNIIPIVHHLAKFATCASNCFSMTLKICAMGPRPLRMGAWSTPKNVLHQMCCQIWWPVRQPIWLYVGELWMLETRLLGLGDVVDSIKTFAFRSRYCVPNLVALCRTVYPISQIIPDPYDILVQLHQNRSIINDFGREDHNSFAYWLWLKTDTGQESSARFP